MEKKGKKDEKKMTVELTLCWLNDNDEFLI